ncbi:MAG TPA: hypothetical protein VLZ74_09795 [Methylocella sp.]|nr:hypothetical protein [Methylocella sp.]
MTLLENNLETGAAQVTFRSTKWQKAARRKTSNKVVLFGNVIAFDEIGGCSSYKEHFGARRMGLILLSEMFRLYNKRLRTDGGLDFYQWRYCIAAVLNKAPRGHIRINGRKAVVTWPGLDALERELSIFGMSLAEREMAALIADVCKRKKPIGRKELGSRLKLTPEERLDPDIRAYNLIPVGETAESLKEKRQIEKAGKKRKDRRAKGSVSRDAYEANSLTREAPWEKEGISKATWYRKTPKDVLAELANERRRKAQAETAERESSTLEIRETSTPVRQVWGRPVTRSVTICGRRKIPVSASEVAAAEASAQYPSRLNRGKVRREGKALHGCSTGRAEAAARKSMRDGVRPTSVPGSLMAAYRELKREELKERAIKAVKALAREPRAYTTLVTIEGTLSRLVGMAA